MGGFTGVAAVECGARDDAGKDEGGGVERLEGVVAVCAWDVLSVI